MTDIIISDTTALTTQEQSRLDKLEATIKRGLETFVEVGNALALIRDEKLYREDYKTFADYCQNKWNFGKSRAYQLIAASETVQQIASTSVDTPLPENEAVARPLAQLAPERRAEAWRQALSVSQGAPTQEQVKDVVDTILGKKGRFEQGKYYPVVTKSKTIFNAPCEKNYGNASHFAGCDWIKADDLNGRKQYDAYTLVEVPDLEVPPAPDWLKPDYSTNYPVNMSKKIIYFDPQGYTTQSQSRYPGAQWQSGNMIATMWGSLVYRLCDFEIRGPEPESTAWAANSEFKVGMKAQCFKQQCAGRLYAFEQWKPSGVFEGWICPEGHTTKDTMMPVAVTDEDDDEDDFSDDDDIQDDETEGEDEESTTSDGQELTDDVEEMLDHINDDLAPLIEDIKKNASLVAVAVAPEMLALYKAKVDASKYLDYNITDETLAALDVLMKFVKGSNEPI